MNKLWSVVPIAVLWLALPAAASASPITSVLGNDSADWWEVIFGTTGVVTTETGIPGWNTQLFLFDFTSAGPGTGVVARDNDGSDPDARLGNIPPGHYFLAVTQWNQDPLDATFTRIFGDGSGRREATPGTGAFHAWLNPYGDILAGLEYSITFEGLSQEPVHHNPVPEPGTLLLMGTGLAVLAHGLRRRRAGDRAP
jgi:hypothetical protein